MPNWCVNFLEVKGDIKELTSKFKPDGMLFETLVGGKYQGDDGGWYDHNIETYGTKWDVPMNEIDPSVINDNELAVSFATAWSPPIGFCKMLSKKYNCLVRIEFDEGGCDFAGYATFKDGVELDEKTWDFMEGLYMLGREEEFWSNIEYYISEDMDLDDMSYMTDADKKYLEELKTKHNESSIQEE